MPDGNQAVKRFSELTRPVLFVLAQTKNDIVILKFSTLSSGPNHSIWSLIYFVSGFADQFQPSVS